jgi:V/A-type H+-transporting ATPase subunit A
LQQNAFDKEDAYCPLERQIEIFTLIQKIFGARFEFNTHDEARGFFLGLQNELKNINFLSYGSAKYKEAFRLVSQKIAMKEVKAHA